MTTIAYPRTNERLHTEIENRIFTAETPRAPRCTSSYYREDDGLVHTNRISLCVLCVLGISAVVLRSGSDSSISISSGGSSHRIDRRAAFQTKLDTRRRYGLPWIAFRSYTLWLQDRRRKLESAGATSAIRTVRGIGYALGA